MMLEYFAERKKRIIECLYGFFSLKKDAFSSGNRWGEDSALRLLEFTSRGKMIRGGLVLLCEEFFNPEPSGESVKAAAALEIFQSGFLIHDDIMDGDLFRRGEKTINHQYSGLAADEDNGNPSRTGDALGICVGDLAFFAGYDLLAAMNIEPAVMRKAVTLCSEEYYRVGLAQMNDVYLGGIKRAVTENEILDIYRYKTARYTFSLPMTLGAVLGGADESVISGLDSFGEALGVIFQIRDDELGIFSTDGELGKPVGSDIRENKKTLYYIYIHEQLAMTADKNTRQRVEKAFGNPEITEAQLESVRQFVAETGIKKRADDVIESYSRRAGEILTTMELDTVSKDKLAMLLSYSLTRRM
ncbi:MAG: hypothetical protein A2Y33_01230 [Spirochaetes bacterium GWF1_51_8]|nr:MAG: hypothetical protein A2Y33_01230 [Spirochaetes bacterium GWF1_51_8]